MVSLVEFESSWIIKDMIKMNDIKQDSWFLNTLISFHSRFVEYCKVLFIYFYLLCYFILNNISYNTNEMKYKLPYYF